VILAADAIGSYDEEYHRESVRYLRKSISQVLGNRDLKETLGAT
jgi:hypothetical protein